MYTTIVNGGTPPPPNPNPLYNNKSYIVPSEICIPPLTVSYYIIYIFLPSA